MTPLHATPPAAIALMLLAMALIPAGDTAGKLLTDDLGAAPLFVAWSRFALGAVLLVPFLRGAGLSPGLLVDWRIWLRGVLVVAAIVAMITALSTESLANVFGAFFVGPILSYFLSALFLGERIHRGQTLMLFLAFLGVLVVVRPGFGMSLGTGLGLLGGVFYGSFLVTSRWLSGVARPRALLLSQLVIGALVLAPFALPRLPEFSAPVLWLTLASALGSMLGNLALVFAYRHAPASRLAPLVYAQLLAATAYGYAVFGDWPDAFTLLGLTVLMAAGAGSFLIRTR
ncbi:DMT family transporter [Plastorhodobacter daqingensis]|uniref:DMT family transporter n=1 Tax=Plastorhodobacter daqingensis TaxID=1387281 RepID=A0ABW2UK01_9RHOB